MIETIYSNENGEGNPGNKTQASFKLPKNVRQIGKSNTNKKIYVEDYVMTYVKQLAGGDYSSCRAAVLVGQCIRLDNCRNIFISGAVEISDFDVAEEINFSNDTWTKIYEEIKKFFVETEIVGWYIGGPGYLLEDTEKITKAHINNFAGQDKIFFAFDSLEREEAFYSYENNRLTRVEGYYIYYEKNEEMQTYMIEHKEPQSVEEGYEDRVARDIRTVLQSKKPSVEESKGVSRLMYAAGTLLAIIVLVVGAAILNNYDQMKSMQDTLKYLSQNMEEVQSIVTENRLTDTIDSKTTVVKGQSSDVSSEETEAGQQEQTDASADTPDNSLDVEVVPGKVDPIEENGNQETPEKKETKPAKKDDEESSPTEKPASKESKENTKQTEAKKENKINYYIVVEGDTLADISYKLYKTYTRVNKIMELNNIDNQDLIYVGQKLIVP